MSFIRKMESNEIEVTSPTSLAMRDSTRHSQNDRESMSFSCANKPDSIKHQRKSSFSELLPSFNNLLTRHTEQKEDTFLEISQLNVDKALEPTQDSECTLGPNSRNKNLSASAFNLSSSGLLSSSYVKKHSRRNLLRETFSSLTREKENFSPILENVSTEITYEGYLTKRGHVFTNWKTRFFVLYGNVLEYYSGEDKTKRYGSVIVARVAPWSGESHGFMFYTTKQIPYYVYAASDMEKSNWLKALREFYVEPDEVTCEGYLTRRGHLVPSQRLCYYVLDGSSLRHYTDQQAYRDNGSAMAEVEIRFIAAWDAEQNGLMFTSVTGNVFYATTETEEERQKWISNFKSIASSVSEPVACAGYLTKQGHKRKSWKKRYFILRANIISYYQDIEMANNSKGKALAEVEVEDVQKWDGEAFGFMFMTTEQVPYYVYADNERDRKKWMNALRKLNTMEEDHETEKKRCNNCQAVLTGSRFCGACGFNLRGTGVDRGNRLQQGYSDENMSSFDKDDMENAEEDNTFDELEALSEGARTLLLAVMQTPDSADSNEKESAQIGRMTMGRIPFQQTNAAIVEEKTKVNFENDLRQALEELDKVDEDAPDTQQEMKMEEELVSIATAPIHRGKEKPQATLKLKPNFAIVEEGDGTEKSFRSFADSDEEEKEDQVTQVANYADRRSNMVHMGAMGPRRTLHSLALEPSSDEEDPEHTQEKEDEESHSDFDNGAEIADNAQRKASDASSDLELDTRGIAAFDDVTETKAEQSPSPPKNQVKSTNDLCHYMERELDFAPLFVPSAESPVRCRLYTSMSYTSAKRVLLFLSDSGPLGLWRQDPTNQEITVQHRWSMARYLNRAQQEGYGVILCNPFANSAIVYEAGGYERTVPILESSTPREHVTFVWNQFVMKCKGEIDIIAYARGGALAKSILETRETAAREKIHRIAFIESKHEIDGNESSGVLELLGRRSINWEASFEPLGAQIVDSQARVGCVCLSTGYMPQHGLEADSVPDTIIKAEDPAFAFINANPDRPGMTAVVKFVRGTLRKRKAPSIVKNQTNRKSNILVLGETEIDESSDMSAGGENEMTAVTGAAITDKVPAPYYLPKPTKPKPTAALQASSSSDSNSGSKTMSMKDFELLKVVGQGGFGKVFLCRKLTPPKQGESFAMKVLKKQHVVSSGLVNTTMAERKILTEISHPFVVNLYYAFQSESKLYLVMDYLSGGSLAFHLRRRRKFSEDWARFYAAEVAAAMAHLHSVNIIYRDAKLENVLMDHEGHVRITDFGLSKVGVSDLKGAKTFCGTAAYIAPELLKGHTYGKAADWWSFGILLYEMIGGKPPYYHRNRDIMFQTILKQEWVTFSPSFSDSAVSLIRGLLTRDPMMRLGSGPRGADEVLTHPFFDAIDWPALLEKKVSPPFDPGVGKLDTHYAPRNLNEITTRDRQASVVAKNKYHHNDFDGFSFVGRPSVNKGSVV